MTVPADLSGSRLGPPGNRRPPRRPEVARGAVTAADGLLLVDKDSGVTSHDVVAATRRLAATRKVGHAGTLDPMATGLLVLGVGRATRLLTYLVGADKTYEATIRLGQTTLTEDAEGEVVTSPGCPPPARWPDGAAGFSARLASALAGLTGQIEQVPSAVSAIKVDGVRSYARVRGGEDVRLPARPVTVHSLERRGAPRPARSEDGTAVVDVDLTVSCSSGTYVRALARDLGTVLGCGAHLTALRRTTVGPFDVAEARDLAALAAQVAADGATPVPDTGPADPDGGQAGGAPGPTGLTTMSPSEATKRCFAVVHLDEAEAAAVRRGQFLPGDVLGRAQDPARPVAVKAVAAAGGEGLAAGFAPDGHVVALLTRKDGRVRPVLVLDPA